MTHTLFDKASNQEVSEAYKKSSAWCDLTLVTIGSLTADGQALTEELAHGLRVGGKLTPLGKKLLCRCMDHMAEQSSFGSILDTAYGVSVHQELDLLVHECGFTSVEALHAATALTAKRFGFNDWGMIKKGRRADMILVEGDVTKRYRQIPQFKGRVEGGCDDGIEEADLRAGKLRGMRQAC
ncbi:hypothetical protein MMC18_007808 [Xylographa bjoerkii]|nr:hypothetical protein [Xylographa bjoerkii]